MKTGPSRNGHKPTVLLIRLVEEKQNNFEFAFNQKVVWTKISAELIKMTSKIYT